MSLSGKLDFGIEIQSWMEQGTSSFSKLSDDSRFTFEPMFAALFEVSKHADKAENGDGEEEGETGKEPSRKRQREDSGEDAEQDEQQGQKSDDDQDDEQGPNKMTPAVSGTGEPVH